jgi:hypothetical protein
MNGNGRKKPAHLQQPDVIALPTRPVNELLAELTAEASRSCRCDGGNTPCGPCVAEKKLRNFGKPKAHVRRTEDYNGDVVGCVEGCAACEVESHQTGLKLKAECPDCYEEYGSLACLRPAHKAVRAAINPWQQAVIEACVVHFLDWNENDPAGTLANLISWEIALSNDPRVSESARFVAALKEFNPDSYSTVVKTDGTREMVFRRADRTTKLVEPGDVELATDLSKAGLKTASRRKS